MHWYQGGVSLEIISLLLGHSQLETTRIYARADIEMKRKALEKIEPLQQSGSNHELFDWEDKSLIMRLAGLLEIITEKLLQRLFSTNLLIT